MIPMNLNQVALRDCVLYLLFISPFYIYKKGDLTGGFFSPQVLVKKNLNHVALRNQTKEVLTAMLFKYCITDKDF